MCYFLQIELYKTNCSLVLCSYEHEKQKNMARASYLFQLLVHNESQCDIVMLYNYPHTNENDLYSFVEFMTVSSGKFLILINMLILLLYLCIPEHFGRKAIQNKYDRVKVWIFFLCCLYALQEVMLEKQFSGAIFTRQILTYTLYRFFLIGTLFESAVCLPGPSPSP